jgi:hypothetical protein
VNRSQQNHKDLYRSGQDANDKTVPHAAHHRIDRLAMADVAKRYGATLCDGFGPFSAT